MSMRKIYSQITFFFLLFVFTAFFSSSLASSLTPKLMKIRMPFIKNVGQKNKKVSFYAKTLGGTLFITKDGKLVYSFSKHDEKNKYSILALEENLVGAKIKTIKGTKKSITKVNYFIGNDPKKWKKNIPTYEGVSLGEIYKGITLTLKAYGNNVEKIFKVKAGADPERIKLSLKGAKELRIDKKTGELIVLTDLGEVRFTKPIAYQIVNGKKKEVEVRYKLLSKNSYAFVIGEYDRSRELVIDPLLASTYLGGGSYEGSSTLQNSVLGIAINKNTGDIYIAGVSDSTNYPTTTGAVQTSRGGSNLYVDDMVVSRLSSDLSQLLSSTYLGGIGNVDDKAADIAIDSQGNVVVAGVSEGNDFPGTPANSYPGNPSGVVAKLTPDLSSVIAAKYFNDGCPVSNVTVVAVDSNDNIFFAG